MIPERRYSVIKGLAQRRPRRPFGDRIRRPPKSVRVFSPIARALIGRSAGDQVEVQTPGGVRKYEVLEVRYE